MTAAFAPTLIAGTMPAQAEGNGKNYGQGGKEGQGGNASAGMSPVGLPMPRAYHTVTLLHDRRLLIAGGIGPGNRAQSNVLIYDVERQTWTEAASMNMARYQHAAIRLEDGRVLVTGGLNKPGSPMFGAEIYSPHTDTWSPAPALLMARYGHTLSALEDGNVLVSGGILDGLLSSIEFTFGDAKQDLGLEVFMSVKVTSVLSSVVASDSSLRRETPQRHRATGK